MSPDPPTMAVLPSAETATEVPCKAAPVLPVPSIFSPCCKPGYRVGVIVKVPALTGEHPPLVMEIVPVLQGITMPVKVVAVLEIIRAGTPPIVNDGVLFRFVPVIVTNVPAGPVLGEKEVTVSNGLTINAPDTLLVAVPQVPVTTQ